MMDCVEGQPLLLVALFLLTASTPGAVSSPRFFYWLCNDKRGCFTCLVAVAAQPARAGGHSLPARHLLQLLPQKHQVVFTGTPSNHPFNWQFVNSITATPALHGEKSSRVFPACQPWPSAWDVHPPRSRSITLQVRQANARP